MSKVQVLGGERADQIYWWIHDYGKEHSQKYWSVVPTNPIRVEICSRGSLPNEVVIATANIGDWVCQDSSGDFYVETNEGVRVEPINRFIPEPAFTLYKLTEEIRKDRELFINGIENTKKNLVHPESPLSKSETELVIHTLDTLLNRLRNTPIGDSNGT